MNGKVILITGATSGIGEVAAEELAAMGARIVFVARDHARADATLAKLRSKNPAAHRAFFADLSRLSEMKRVGAEILAAEPRIDVLINNAGAMFGKRQLTEGNLELSFATNHMAYFVLTHILRDRLIASAPARIVNTSSDAHRGFKLDFNDLQSAQDYGGYKVYGKSKLANILFTRELARKLAATGVTANALHPGFVATRFGDNSGGGLAGFFKAAKLFAISPEAGAKTIVYLAASDDVANVTGQYFYKCEPKTPTQEAQDDAAAARLWAESARLAGIEA